MERIFKRFDPNDDGKIWEALRTLGSNTSDDIHRMIKEIDTDGDGYINHKEFYDLCRANLDIMKDVTKIF
ncbi:putative EF-hand domain-containing protein [Dioscorea sansibarensis]